MLASVICPNHAPFQYKEDPKKGNNDWHEDEGSLVEYCRSKSSKPASTRLQPPPAIIRRPSAFNGLNGTPDKDNSSKWARGKIGGNGGSYGGAKSVIIAKSNAVLSKVCDRFFELIRLFIFNSVCYNFEN